jgi:hypothetical protein
MLNPTICFRKIEEHGFGDNEGSCARSIHRPSCYLGRDMASGTVRNFCVMEGVSVNLLLLEGVTGTVSA